MQSICSNVRLKIVFLVLFAFSCLSACTEVKVDFDNLPYVDDYYTLSAQEIIERANAGDPFAQIVFSGFYLWGVDGHAYDESLAKKWIKEACVGFDQLAQKGNMVAQHAFQGCYAQGIVQDADKVITYLTRSAEQGYTQSQYDLGEIYRRNIYSMDESIKNQELSDYWYKKALPEVIQGANSGEVIFQLMLSQMYLYGSGGLEKDIAQWEYWSGKVVESYRQEMNFNSERIFNLLPSMQLITIYLERFDLNEKDASPLFKSYALTEWIIEKTASDSMTELMQIFRATILGKAGKSNNEKSAFEAFAQKCMKNWTEECY